jgi:hypothetical protein
MLLPPGGMTPRCCPPGRRNPGRNRLVGAAFGTVCLWEYAR